MLMESIQTFQLGTHVNTHNLTVILGRLVATLNTGEAAFGANLTSALGGACTIALLYAVLYRMTSSANVAAVTASVTMVSHSMWWHSTIVESYALNGLFTVVVIGWLADLQRQHAPRKLLGLFFVSGLALFNHAQMGILAAGVFVYFIAHGVRLESARLRWFARTGAQCFAAFGLGALPYVALFLRDVGRDGFRHTLWQATGGPFHDIMLQGDFLPGLQDVAYLVALQFPSVYLVAVAFGVVGLVRSWKASPSLFALLAILGLNTIFFMTYNTWDKFAFLLPSFIILAFTGVFTVERVLQWTSGRALRTTTVIILVASSVMTPVYLYAQLSRWGAQPGFWHARYNNNYTFNTHNCAEYIANPNKGTYRDIAVFAERILETLPQGAILVDSDSRTFYPLRYLQVYEGWRPDIRLRLVNSWGFENWGLSKQDFFELVERAYRGNEDLSIVSLGHPFEELLATDALKDRYRFDRRSLDSERWIYKLALSGSQ